MHEPFLCMFASTRMPKNRNYIINQITLEYTKFIRYREHLRARHNAGIGHPQKALFDVQDKAMASVREMIEWRYGEEMTTWTAITDWRRLKLLERGNYVVNLSFFRMLVQNLYTCLYHSKVSARFGVPPPCLEEYLSWN